MFDFSKTLFYLKKGVAAVLSVILLTSAASSGSNWWITDSKFSVSYHGCRDSIFSVYSYSFADSTEKINSTAPLGRKSNQTVYLAKGEGEYAQIAIRSKYYRGNSFISVGEMTNAAGDKLETELYWEYETEASDGTGFELYPDALVPVSNPYNFRCLKETNYVFLIKIKTTAETKPGDYSATISFGSAGANGNKHETSSAKLNVHVWNFEVSESDIMRTAVGLSKSLINALYKAFDMDITNEQLQQLYIDYYEMMLDHNISCYDLPYSILDSRADAYMSDPRVKSFCVPYTENESTLRQYYDKLSQNEEWLAKAYFYPIDEPKTQEQLDRYVEITNYLSRVWPGYKMVTPFCADKTEAVDAQGNAIYNSIIQTNKSTIICPVTYLINDSVGMLDRLYQRQANGEEFWWYVCCGPRPNTDYCNFFVQYPGFRTRILFWQQYDYNVTGFLFWSSNYWYTGSPTGWEVNALTKIWRNSRTTEFTGYDTYGDGFLMYPGVKGFSLESRRFLSLSEYEFDRNMPVSSLRLELISDGIEDYAYLKMAERLIGKDKTDKILSKVTSDLTHYTYSDSTFANARLELGNAIERASK